MGPIPQPQAVKKACHFWRQPWRGHQSQGAPSTHLGRHRSGQGRRGWPRGPASPWPTPGEVPDQSRRGDNSQLTLPPEPSFNNSSRWVKCFVEQLKTPTWWQELSMVPNQMDVQEFTRWIWASFQLPKASSHTQGVDNNYLAPPAPQSLECDQFLPVSNIRLHGQDYHMRQPQKTLAYAKALQDWVEKASHWCWVSLTKWQKAFWSSREHWALNHVYQCRGPGGCPTFTLGQDCIIPDIGAHRSCNLSDTKSQQELKGSHQRYICGGLWHRAFKTNSHHLGRDSITGSWWQAPPPGLTEIARSLCGTTHPMKLWASH